MPVQREEIRNAQQAKKPMETRSAFGGSQSASASVSTNFNRIVEGVEKLVESDTYEAPPMPRLPEILQPTQTSTNYSNGIDMNSLPRQDSYRTPIVPPGLGLQHSPTQHPHPYSPLFTGFTGSNIWSPNHPSLSNDVSPQRRPDITQQAHLPGLGSQSRALSPGIQDAFSLGTPSGSVVAIRNSLLLQEREIQERSSSQFGSNWTPSIAPSQTPYDGSRHDMLALYGGFPHQPVLSSSGFPSSHDHAFINSTVSPFPTSDGRQSSQDRPSPGRFGAIGQQTPPCGQAG
jgi:hypothetical protein